MRTSFAALAAAALLAAGGAFAQGASGIGATSNAGTFSNSVDKRAGSTGTATEGIPGPGRKARGSRAVEVQAPAAITATGESAPAVTTSPEWTVPLGAEHDPDFQRRQRLK